MVTLLMVWFYWLIIVLMSDCECVLWVNGIELKWFWFELFRQELNELWCLLTWFTWTIVNAYWFIGPLQSLVLKEHWCLLDIQYSPQGIDGSLKWFEFVHFNSWLWQLKTHGYNATWRFHQDTFMVSSLNSNNSNCLLQDISDMGYTWYESCM